MLDRIEFLIVEAMVAMRRNTWMTFAAVTTAAMALFFLGGMGYVMLGLANFVADLGKKVEMKAFVRDTVTDAQAKALGDKILKLDGVASVRFVSRAAGLAEFVKENPSIDVRGLEIDNPLPNAYVVNVRDMKQFKSVAATLGQFKEIEPGGVKFPAEEQNFMADTLRIVPVLGLILGTLMLLTSGVLIYNAIRMTVLARRREIKIMQLVGATRFMVWAPMLIEGVVQGAFGGALAACVLACAHWTVQVTLIRNLTAMGRPIDFPLMTALVVLSCAGAVYGLVCSAMAVRGPVAAKGQAA